MGNARKGRFLMGRQTRREETENGTRKEGMKHRNGKSRRAFFITKNNLNYKQN
jgi:hypothetical protein